MTARNAFRFASDLQAQGLYMCGELLSTTQPVVLSDPWGEVYFVPLPYADPGVIRHLLQDDSIHTLREPSGPFCLAASGFLKENAWWPWRTPMLAGRTSSDSERPLDIGGTEQISRIFSHRINYTALGHLHGPQKVGAEIIGTVEAFLNTHSVKPVRRKGVIVGKSIRKGRSPAGLNC